MAIATRGRRVASVILGILLGLFTLSMYAPMPRYGLWIVRFAAREAALFGVGLAALSLLFASSRRGRALAALCGVLVSLPVVAALPLFSRHHVPFSIGQYASGAPSVEVSVNRDVILDTTLPDLRFDLYRGAGLSPHPFVVIVHGGSWQHGDKGDVVQVSRQLAASGITAIDMRYRLSPEFRFPAAVQDVKCLLGRLRERSIELGIDPHRGALLGRSAGGQIVLLAGYSTGDENLRPACAVADEPVQAVVAIYPFTDLRTAHDKPPFPDPEETASVMEAHLGGPPSDPVAAVAYARASPASYVVPRAQKALPKTLFLHGKSDMLVPVWHSEKLHQALRSADQESTLVTIPWAEHGFDFRPGGAAEQLERALVVRFLQGGHL